MKKSIISSVAVMSTISMAALGAFSVGTLPVQAAQVHHTAKHAAPKLKLQHIYLTIMPGSHLGPDGKMHDSYSPTDFTVVQGVPVQVTIYNYDGGPHSFTCPTFGLNVVIPGTSKNGVPNVKTFTFTPQNTGSFMWQCELQCDGGSGTDFSMWNDGYMVGTVKVVPNNGNEQFVTLTVQGGLDYGPTKKTKHGTSNMHDAFSPASFTVTPGIPVHLSVYNWDTGDHSITSSALGLNLMIKGADKAGDVKANNFTFTVPKAGKYKWQCEIKCDGGMTSYSMTHVGYMEGYINAVN